MVVVSVVMVVAVVVVVAHGGGAKCLKWDLLRIEKQLSWICV